MNKNLIIIKSNDYKYLQNNGEILLINWEILNSTFLTFEVDLFF